MKKYKINHQDVMKWAKEYDGPKFHALLTDAPYHLTTITKRFGKKSSAPAKFGTDGVFQRASKGFMGNTWDGGDISFRPETWAALGEHLYPGAFGMTFGGSRTAHRIAVAIEDAGFIIHPMIGWVYGSGFPKATRVKGHKEFDGHRYGLQALKPSLEPIIVFQKPYDDKPIVNMVTNGAGALNIDAARISLSDRDDPRLGGKGSWKTDKMAKNVYAGGYAGDDVSSSTLGRWPANFILDDTMSKSLDAQSGVQKGGFVRNRTAGARPFNNNGKDTGYHTDDVINEPDGGASRFFYNVQTQLDASDPFIYQKKPSGKERDAGLNGKNPHPTVKSLDLNRYLASLLLPPDGYAPRRLLVPFSGVMSESIGAYLAGWEYIEAIEMSKEYCTIGEKRMKFWMKQNPR